MAPAVITVDEVPAGGNERQMVTATDDALLETRCAANCPPLEDSAAADLLGDGEPGDTGAAHGAERAITGTRGRLTCKHDPILGKATFTSAFEADTA